MHLAPSKCFVIALAILVCGPLIIAQNAPAVPKADEQELIRLEDQWYKAYLNSDADTMNRMEGEDMIVITPFNNADDLSPMQKKRSFAARSAERKAMLAKRKRTLSNIQVRVLGDVAILNGLQNDSADDGTDQTRALYTSVWAKRGGTWQIINAQWTMLSTDAVKK